MRLLSRDRSLVPALNRPIGSSRRCLPSLFGVRAAEDLPIDAVPDVTNIRFRSSLPAPALSPVEVEQYVSIPVERTMAGMPKVARFARSRKGYGLSVVTVVFADDTNIYFARQMVGERMRKPEAAVPACYSKPDGSNQHRTWRGDLSVRGSRRRTLAHGARRDTGLVHCTHRFA